MITTKPNEPLAKMYINGNHRNPQTLTHDIVRFQGQTINTYNHFGKQLINKTFRKKLILSLYISFILSLPPPKHNLLTGAK